MGKVSVNTACAICEKLVGDLCPVESDPIRELMLHNYANNGLLFIGGATSYFGVVLKDNRFICARCEKITRLFEDFFDAFDHILYRTSFIKPLVNWVYSHIDVIPTKLYRGAYLPRNMCEQVLKDAGIDLVKAKAEVEDAWRKKLL